MFFDLDGTLVAFDDGFDAVLEDAFDRVVGAYEDAWGDVYGEAFSGAFEALDDEPYSAGMSAVVREFGLDADPEALTRALAAAEVEGVHATPGASVLLERVAARGPVGVLTNGVRSLQSRKLAATGLDDHVDALVTSYDAGAHKPAPDAFVAAEAALHATDYVMVGDSADADVAGAKAVGWRAVHLGGDDTPTVSSLVGLADLADTFR
ncbi:haloacid dehalogenase [Halocalculus aciditolerans]|uniref:Haloacid dehalogenase n=1 Tax=Halocalculus aciditolerans TaxID=1383812 RepID=A0A830FFL8_9EURY|nr:haloacid dehalogenase [Halocalculus aciditolerans]